MMPNPALLIVSAFFFIALAAVLYVAVWGTVSAVLSVYGKRISYTAQKRLLLMALLLPPVLALLPTVNGTTFRHLHNMALGGHHHALCRAVFTEIFSWRGLGGGALSSFALGALAWLIVAVGVFLMLRLMWASVRLERGLSPHLEPPSAKLLASLTRVGRRTRIRDNRFFECAIPIRYSCVIGFWSPRCVLSRAFIASASNEELDAVVAHELSHMRAQDVMATALVGVVTCLFFYLRPVRLLAMRWREAVELAADDAAARITGNPLAVASAILHTQSGSGVSQQRNGFLLVAVPFADQSVCPPSRRIERLLDQVEYAKLPVTESGRGRAWGWGITMVLAAAFVGVLFSPDAACLAHCSLEAVRNLLS